MVAPGSSGLLIECCMRLMFYFGFRISDCGLRIDYVELTTIEKAADDEPLRNLQSEIRNL